MKHIAIIIVTFNRKILTKQTLESLFATVDKDLCSIHVVDNNSLKDTGNLLFHYRQQMTSLTFLNDNRGKPYAWNLGVRIANEQCIVKNLPIPTHYLFCDNDLYFQPHWPEIMLNTYEEHKDIPLGGLSGARWSSHPTRDVRGNKYQINIVPNPTGCCLLMGKEIYEKFYPWKTTRLIRTVDTSYYREARRRGYLLAAIHPKSVIRHMGFKQRSWHIQTGQPRILP